MRAALEVSFAAHERAYNRVFERCGLKTYEVEAESGIMGGRESWDYLAPAESGENELVLKARSPPAPPPSHSPSLVGSGPFLIRSGLAFADCSQELELLSEVASAMGEHAPIAIRINPDVHARTHAKIATGTSETKFGIPWRRAREVYAQAAPMSHVDRLQHPLLVLHGTADVNVPFIHSVLLMDHVLKAGKGDLVSFMVYPGELHYFDRSFVVRDAWQRVDVFFKENLKP